MNKNLLLAGVSAAALALSAGVAFATADNNTSDNGGVTNTAFGGALTTNSNSYDTTNGNNNSNQHNNNSVDDHNHGQIGVGNVDVSVLGVDFNGSVDNSSNEKNEANFKSNSSVTSSVLSATIAASDVDFKPQADDTNTYDGNLVDVNSFQSVNGIAGVNQNVGINSNNQQSVTVASGAISINTVGAR